MSVEERHLSIHDFPLSEDELDEWDGICLELVNDLLHSHPEGAILYVDNLPDDHYWRYHAVLLLDGVVYDAWHPEVAGKGPIEYAREVFGPWCELTIFGGTDNVAFLCDAKANSALGPNRSTTVE
jgi:hypothetical protein